jgi:hypothetical protein
MNKDCVLLAIVTFMSIGANPPHEIAITLNTEPRILLITLAAIVLFSLARRILKLPGGLDKQQGFVIEEGSRVLFRAVATRRVRTAREADRRGFVSLLLEASKAEVADSTGALPAT